MEDSGGALEVSLFFMELHSGFLSMVGAPGIKKTVESLRSKELAIELRVEMGYLKQPPPVGKYQVHRSLLLQPGG